MRGKCAGLDSLFLPRNAFRADTEIMLDGITREEAAKELGVPIRIGSDDGGRFCGELLRAVYPV
jgi:hypothetical protein